MTTTVLFIALAGLLPLLVCRALTRSGTALFITGCFTCAVVGALGGAKYAALDIVVVLVGMVVIGMFNGPSRPRDPPSSVAAPQVPVAAVSLVSPVATAPLAPAQWVDLSGESRPRRARLRWFLVPVLLLGLVGYFTGSPSQKPDSPVSANVGTAVNRDRPVPMTATKRNEAVTARESELERKNPAQPNQRVRSLEECLRIRDEAQMVRCLERAP